MNNNHIRLISQVSINRMISEFLKNNRSEFSESEISSKKIFENPDLLNLNENKERWNLFKNKYWLFNRFIPHCDWYECEILIPESFSFVKIINEISWFDNIPTQSRLVKDLNSEKFNQSEHKIKIEAFKNEGIETFIYENYLILIGKYDSEELSLIDGNHRFAALYESSKLNSIKNMRLKVIIGLTYGNCRWLGDTEIWEKRPSKGNEERYVLNIW
jgi:hypothetical protein